MREMEAAFEQTAASIECHTPRCRLISSVTGQAVEDDMRAASYWRRQVSQPVRFRDAIRTLGQSGYRIFLEVGPGTTLSSLGRQCLDDKNAVWLPSLRRSRGEWQQMKAEFLGLRDELRAAIFEKLNASLEEKKRVLQILRRTIDEIRGGNK